MTVATGVGGTTTAGAVLGVTLVQTDTAPADVGVLSQAAGIVQAAGPAVQQLPFTGANHVVQLLVLAMLLLLTGALALGLARRHRAAGASGTG